MNYQPEPIKDGEIIEVQAKEITTALAPVLTTQDLQTRIKEETEQRKLITEFISQHMKAGVDYGKIKIKTRDGREVESKPSLFKPGSEKFCSLFHFRPTFERDDDTWEMSGKKPGLYCYKCELKAANGAIVGEGRGSAAIGEKQGWTDNNAMKIAEKRAQIDAVLRTGGLSDFFTQDLEDMNIQPESANRPQPQQRKPEPQPTQRPQPETKPEPDYAPLSGMITERQNAMIFRQIGRLKTTKDEIKTRFKIEHINQLTKQQASDLIDKLLKMQPQE